MFTGIIQAVGFVRGIIAKGGDLEMSFDTDSLGLDAVSIGASISVNGCCLTVTRMEASIFTADVSRETLAVTTLGRLRERDRVNLEKALYAGQALGGHYVTGHIDGIGTVLNIDSDARSHRVVFEVPPELARYIARKGSVCVDGVSLTVNAVEGSSFAVNLIPHTLQATILGDYRRGTPVNLEVDIIARYLERLMQPDLSTRTAT